MMVKKSLSVAILVMSLSCAEKEAGFKGGVGIQTQGNAQNAEPETPPAAVVPPEVPSAETVTTIAPVDNFIQAAEALTLSVSLSATEVRSGGLPIKAHALLSQPVDAKVNWSLEGPANTDIGQIDAEGNYLSPAVSTLANVPTISVTVIATLESDPTIFGKKTLQVIPAKQVFVGCSRGSQLLPIAAEVFPLPVNTAKIPDFSLMTKSSVVCLDKFDIPTQSWLAGFPGSPELKQWFGLRSRAKITIPKTGSYVFQTNSDDGSRLYIDGQTIVDNDFTHSTRARNSTDIHLTVGKHDLLLDYYQGPADQIALQLLWKVPGSNDFVIVPTSAFSAE